MQDNQYTCFPSDLQGDFRRGPRKRFGLGSVILSGIVCFLLGALACAVVFMATGLLETGSKTAYESAATPNPTEQVPEEPGALIPVPTATQEALPEESPSSEGSASDENRGELTVPALGSAAMPVIDETNLITSVFNQVSPAVCGVSNRIMVYSDVTKRYNEEENATGTGIILTSDGYIVTNNHIITDADKVYVTCNGVEYEAEIIGTDATVDIAVLKAVNASGLTPAALGDSSALSIGDTAIAIGDPLGTLTSTCTTGIISGLDREINTDGKVQNYIQTDAAVNPGNSGGPLINKLGQVVGIVSMKTVVAGYDEYGNAISAEGLGYAIPINDAIPVVKQLIQYGYIPHPAIGIQGYEVTEFLSEELQVPQGVYVSEVEAGGPAEAAGIKVDDVIVGIDGETVTTFDELSTEIKTHNVGDTVKLSVWRTGEQIEISLTLGDMNAISDAASDAAESQNSGDDFYAPDGN